MGLAEVGVRRANSLKVKFALQREGGPRGGQGLLFSAALNELRFVLGGGGGVASPSLCFASADITPSPGGGAKSLRFGTLGGCGLNIKFPLPFLSFFISLRVNAAFEFCEIFVRLARDMSSPGGGGM